jgi:hypothetical protein
MICTLLSLCFNDAQRYYKNSADLTALTLNFITKDSKLRLRYNTQFNRIIFINCCSFVVLRAELNFKKQRFWNSRTKIEKPYRRISQRIERDGKRTRRFSHHSPKSSNNEKETNTLKTLLIRQAECEGRCGDIGCGKP